MVELEETFITQLQRVADTYKREMQEQQGSTAELESRLRAAQLAAHQVEGQCADAQKALQVLQVNTLAWRQHLGFVCIFNQFCELHAMQLLSWLKWKNSLLCVTAHGAYLTGCCCMSLAVLNETTLQ